MWKLIHRVKPNGDVLNRNHMEISLLCPFGYESEEIIENFFFKCPYSQAIWWDFQSTRTIWADFASFTDWIISTLISLNQEDLRCLVEKVILLLTYLLLSRNLV